MNIYQEDRYGEHIAPIYDEWYLEFDEAMLKVLVELASGGRVLELGIGTGRVALPLQQRSVDVYGIDASEAMITRLRAKPDGDKKVVLGNFADVAVEGQFSLIYVVFSTFFGLLTQDEQIRCFENVTQHLGPEGAFLIESYVPALKRFNNWQTVRADGAGVNEVRLEASQLDPVSQQIIGQKIVFRKKAADMYRCTDVRNKMDSVIDHAPSWSTRRPADICR